MNNESLKRPVTEKEWTDLGTTNYLKGDIITAIENFSHALTIDPNYTDAHFGLGNCYFAQEDWDKALNSYKTVLRNFHKVCRSGQI